MTKFSHLSNAQLASTIKFKTETERRLTVEIIELLEEIDRRKLHLEMGYGSLMDYCVKELRYSESAAYRRISAMRLSRDVPQVKEALKEGAINLVTVSQVQSLFRDQDGRDSAYTREEKIDLLKSLENTSKREAERIIAEELPLGLPKRDQIRAIPGQKVRVDVEISAETSEKLERIKALLSHRNPNPSFDELLNMVADIVLKKVDHSAGQIKPGKTDDVTTKAVSGVVGGPTETPDHEASESRESVISTSRDAQPPVVKPRSISVNKRRIVWKEAQAKCTYVDPKSGRQCGSRHQLEVDHRIPVAKGGSAAKQNLRLLCRAHNLLMAAKYLGAKKMAAFVVPLDGRREGNREMVAR